MTAIYIASESEGAGKTSLCATLAWKLGQRGKKVSVFKPVSRVGSESDTDAEVFHTLLKLPTDGWPVAQADDGLTPEILDDIKSAFNQVSEEADLTLIEGSSGLSLRDTKQIVDTLEAKVLVVAPYQTDLSDSQLKPWTNALGDRLAGFVINGLTKYQNTQAKTKLLPSMESEGLVSFGVIPEDRRLLSATADQVAAHLEGRFVVGEEFSDALVEHFMVGGWTMDAGDLYFGLNENKAVVVRGDRPDMQMSALTTPTSCLVCTQGIDPIEYVIYEAEQEEVAVMVVETDTLTTMASLNNLMEGTAFDHQLKLSRFSELIDEYVNLDALYRSLDVEI